MRNDFDLTAMQSIPDPFDAAQTVSPPTEAVKSRGWGPNRNQRARARSVAIAAAGVFEAFAVGAFSLRPNLGRAVGVPIVLEVAIPCVAATSVLILLARRGRFGLGAGAVSLAATVLLAPAVFAAATWAADPNVSYGPAFGAQALACIEKSTWLGVGPLAFALWALRHSFVSFPAWRTAAVGVACGAVATTAISFVCPISASLHVIVGHGSVMALLGVASALSARWLTRA